MTHQEPHRSHRTGWLRAAVLGANDGIVSTASLIIGMAAADTSHDNIVLAGIAGLVAGAMSMAAGEYVSVSSQADTESADLAIEQQALDENYDEEVDELADIYEARGVERDLARQVAEQLMGHDALAAHARDDIGISDSVSARPIQAALSSASTFIIGAALPLLLAAITTKAILIPVVAAGSLFFLALMGAIAARTGGASVPVAALRVAFWGALAMLVTAGIGHLVGVDAPVG